MTPNVARLLIKWGVDKVIGDNLVEFEELNMRRRDGTPVGYTKVMPNVKDNLGVPWWVVHRMHLHEGLVAIAQKEGAKIITNARVTNIDWQSTKEVKVTTQDNKSYTFDLLVGADGVRSIVRKSIMPNVTPAPPTTNCAYRAIVPYSQIRDDPIARELITKLTMEVWMSDKAYIISYPMSAGKDFNMVLSHHRDRPVLDVEDIDMNDLRDVYKDFDPRIKRIVDMVPTARRWPLLVTGPLKTWSTPEKNVVLMGDAAHSMVNHMAQGAATSMEDGAFLAKCLRQVVEGRTDLAQAIAIYEKGRIPKAYVKQQVSFLNGAIWHLPDGPLQEARDRAMAPELKGEQFMRSPNLYGDPWTTMEIYGYDAEKHADEVISEYLDSHVPFDKKTGVTGTELERNVGWWWPKEREALRASKL